MDTRDTVKFWQDRDDTRELADALRAFARERDKSEPILAGTLRVAASKLDGHPPIDEVSS